MNKAFYFRVARLATVGFVASYLIHLVCANFTWPTIVVPMVAFVAYSMLDCHLFPPRDKG